MFRRTMRYAAMFVVCTGLSSAVRAGIIYQENFNSAPSNPTPITSAPFNWENPSGALGGVANVSNTATLFTSYALNGAATDVRTLNSTPAFAAPSAGTSKYTLDFQFVLPSGSNNSGFGMFNKNINRTSAAFFLFSAGTSLVLDARNGLDGDPSRLVTIPVANVADYKDTILTGQIVVDVTNLQIYGSVDNGFGPVNSPIITIPGSSYLANFNGVGIDLGASGNPVGVDVDNIVLTETLVPEPSSGLILLALAGGAAGARRLRRSV